MNAGGNGTRWGIMAIGVLALVGAAVVVGGQVLSGAQPWGPTLTDNMVLAKMLPFIVAAGIAIGVGWGWGPEGPRVERRHGDGALRRFTPGTVALHWIATIGVLFGMVSGAWQYLKGILDVESPIYMPYVYRLHYVGAALLFFAISAFFGARLVRPITAALSVPRGEWIRHLRGLAHEFPRPLGGLIAGFLGFDMRRPAPPVGKFTYYEKLISFPTWYFTLGLISITGLLKGMRYIYPIPGEVLFVVSTLHVAGMVILTVKVLDHLRYVLAPSRWPLFTSMFTTWVPWTHVQRHHQGWLAELNAPREGVDPTRGTRSTSPPPAGTPVAGTVRGGAA